MGLSGKSKSKSKQTNEPPKWALDNIKYGMDQTRQVFDRQQPQLEEIAGMQRDAYGRIAPGAEAGILGAQGQVNSMLAGDYLNGNPYTDGILERTRGDITNQTNAQFSKAGRYGSGSHAGILAAALANAQNAVLYGNYNVERQNQLNAVGQAQNLMGGSQSLLNNAAQLPWAGVNALNSNIRQASNGYGTQTGTQTQSQPFGQMLMGGVLGGLNAYTSGGGTFSDRRMKKDIVQIGTRNDGLNNYQWVYKNDPTGTVQTGFMADEVKDIYPDAFIENFSGTGFAGVNYAAIPQDKELSA